MSLKLIRPLIAAAICTGFFAAPVAAQTYPNKPVKIIVPFAAGGPADNYARFIGQRLQEALGQSFVVEDKPGGGSVIGTDAVAKSTPDGYTLLLMSNTHTVNETLLHNKPFELMRDFVPVAPINYSDLLLVVHPSVKATNLKELLKLAKENPGKLNYASSGPGTPYHMAGELFKAMADVAIVHVPYKGSSGARSDVLGGQVQMMFDAVTTMSEHVRAGKVKALGVTSAKRLPQFPEVPAIAEVLPGYEMTAWFGLFAPGHMAPELAKRISDAARQAIASPQVRQRLESDGATPVGDSPEEFGRFVRSEIVRLGKVVKFSGAKPE